MLVSERRLFESMRQELSALYPGPHAEASIGQALLNATRLLEVRERGGTDLVQAQLQTLDETLTALGRISLALPDWTAGLERMQTGIAAARKLVRYEAMEAARKKLISDFETLLARTIATPDLTKTARRSLIDILGAWEISDRQRLTALPNDAATIEDTSVTQEKMERYLQDRFKEPGLKVTKWQALPGGFGKQTILLEVDGKAVNGGLVLRRDPGEPSVDNDCHRIRNEYHVVRAAFDHGFPAPEALWLDTEHKLLPGGDFIMMRRASGETGGNVFRSKDALSEQLLQVLAGGLAKLHALPPLKDLGDLTDSIRAEWWSLSVPEAVRRYIQGWFDIYMSNAHNPSPMLMSLYGWLLNNIPDAPGRTVLLHGDVGFHNMLVDEGRLSVLVDWEFAHVGDPAEDLGYVKNIVGDSEWDKLMRFYRDAGGADVDPVRLHFHQVWAHVRNASASNMTMGKFDIGVLTELKLVYTGHMHFPLFLQAAFDLVEAGPGGKKKEVDY